MIERFVDDLGRHAGEIVLIGALFAGLIALFIVLAAGLRLLEHIFPRFSRWLDSLDSERRGV